ncbi:MAG: type II toxin-antitoxin system VapC family toxin [Chloroflexi bacterium]|nr:type II toxin-antitoxin system VapC family toxin [Chloroflexota bacterium]
MRAVVDASVLTATLVDAGPEGEWARATVVDGPLAGPEFVLAETSNILRRMERSGRISTLQATASHRDMLRFDIALFSFAPYAERVWALRANVTSYDAWYVALAESLDYPLVTLDRRLSRATGPRCDFITPPRA